MMFWNLMNIMKVQSSKGECEWTSKGETETEPESKINISLFSAICYFPSIEFLAECQGILTRTW